MSQITLSSRLGRAVVGSRSRVVDASPHTGAAGFRLLCVLLVALTVTAVLMLNIERAEGSYVQSRLDAEATRLHDQKVTLQERLSGMQSSDHLAQEAQRLKMVPSTSTATLRLSDGSISGVASMVEGGSTITVDLPSTGIALPADD